MQALADFSIIYTAHCCRAPHFEVLLKVGALHRESFKVLQGGKDPLKIMTKRGGMLEAITLFFGGCWGISL